MPHPDLPHPDDLPPDVPPGVLVPCSEIVERLTDYLEGALPPEEARTVDEHLGVCDGCGRVLDQWRIVVDLSGRVDADDVARLDADTRAGLLAAFRSARS